MALGVKGFLPVSMLDWDGHLVTTLFTPGCNFRCPYCHNPDLVLNSNKLEDIDFSIVEKHLRSKKGWLDGVVVTGGEPLIFKGLEELLSRIKKLGYKIKIDTNGALPGVLYKLFEDNLVDFVAMDIKTSFAKYSKVAGKDWHQSIEKSIQLILAKGIVHEFRTTVVPEYVTMDDVLEIAKFIKGGRVYFLQQFSSQQVLEPQVSNIKKYDDEHLLKMAKVCGNYIPTEVRGLELKTTMAQAV